MFDSSCNLTKEAGLRGLYPFYRGTNRPWCGTQTSFPNCNSPTYTSHTYTLQGSQSFLYYLQEIPSSFYFVCLFVFASIAKSSICPLMVLSNERVTDNIRGGRALQVRLGDLILHLGVASAHDTHGDPCKAYSFN